MKRLNFNFKKNLSLVVLLIGITGFLILNCHGVKNTLKASNVNIVYDSVWDKRGFYCKKPAPQNSKCIWNSRPLTFTFGLYPPKLDRIAYEKAIERAIATWSAVLPFEIKRVNLTKDPDIIVTWALKVPTDPLQNDGYIAIGDPPPGCFISFYNCRPKPLVFMTKSYIPLKEYKWAIQGESIDSNAYDIESFALHEFGHLLGLLAHCDDPGDKNCKSDQEVMQKSLLKGVIRRVLTISDIEKIQKLYPTH